MGRYGPAVVVALLAVLVTSCGSPAVETVDPVARTVAVSPSTAESSEPISPAPSVQTVALPSELVGTWQSVDQGSAEDVIEIHGDATYLRAMLLMQQRPTGVFSFSIGTTGHVEVEGPTLRLVPTSGTQSMSDPDAPSDNYTDRPLDDLTPDVYRWTVSDGSLWLDGEYGLVEFRPAT